MSDRERLVARYEDTIERLSIRQRVDVVSEVMRLQRIERAARQVVESFPEGAKLRLEGDEIRLISWNGLIHDLLGALTDAATVPDDLTEIERNRYLDDWPQA